MEQLTKKTRQDMIGKEFCALVAQSDFASCYYKLCQQYPLRMEKVFSFSCIKKEMLQILSEIGQTPQWDARDKSYSFNFTSGELSFTRGFVLQRTTVDFWFSANRDSERIGGGNYTNIARAVIELIDHKKIPNPPFPRPECYSHDELRAVLRECFQLSELLCSALEKIPLQKAH